MMDERPTYTPAPSRPVLLAVGCRGALLARCREAAARLLVDLVAVDLLAIAGTMAAQRPLVMLVAADLYGFDPEEFDALAQSVSARRLLVEEGEPVERLAARLAETVNESARNRAAAEARLTKPAPPPRKSGGSGIRWTSVGAARIEPAGSPPLALDLDCFELAAKCG
jgi:hypothetical protein